MRALGILLFIVALAGLAGCGGTHSSSAPATTTTVSSPAPASTAATATAATTTAATPSQLTPEAQAAATGDIPDNQVFLTFRNAAAGYSMKYPEGWAQQGAGAKVTFRDKNNIVRIDIAQAPKPTTATVKGAQQITISAQPALKLSYTTQSAPNAVTGKRVTLVVDRYYLWRGGKRAVVDLGTPRGVDNVDAYRLMIESFKWR
jgi:hypothetical protein